MLRDNRLFEWMTYFHQEDDRSREWTLDELKSNLSRVRPEIRDYILLYHEGGFDLVYARHRREIYERLRLNG